MRRLMFVAAALLALSPLAGFPVSAQDDGADFRIGPQHEPWAGVSKPEPLPWGLPTDGQILQPFEVFFSEEYAAVPELESAEFMIVQVVQGAFALAAGQEGTFIVEPAGGHPIQHMQEIADAPHFELIDSFVRDTSGQLCTSICAIPLDTAVQVKAGDTVTAFDNSVCLWCLLDTNAEAQDKGLLIVWVLLDQGIAPDEFSWAEDWEEHQAAPATPEADATPAAMGWAMFNPQARCRNP